MSLTNAQHSKKWREAHPGKHAESCRKWRLANNYDIASEIREWRRLHPGHNAACCKKWRTANPKQYALTQKNWRKANPEKAHAQNLINAAIRRGRIKRMPCVICGNQKAQAHHEDYLKPLEATWLCLAHHKEKHRKTTNKQ